MNLKEKRDLCLMKEVLKVRHTIKNWYLHAGSKFMSSKVLSDSEEGFLEEITNFFLDNLDNIEDIEREIYEKNLI